LRAIANDSLASHWIAGQPLGALRGGDAGLEFGHDRTRMHPEPLLDDAAVPESVQARAGAAARADVIAAPVVLGRSMQGLVNVSDPVAQELERCQLLLVGRLRRCQDSEVVLDRAHHARFSQWARIVIKAGGVAWEINEVLGGPLPRPIGPVARRPEGGELIILPDERVHAVAGGIVELKEGQLTDGLMAEAAPGQG
jgi:hypothetical protein